MTKTVFLLCISLLVIVVKCVSVSSDDVVLSPRTLLRGKNILIPSKKMGGEQERKESNFDLNRKSRRNLLNFSDLIDVNIEFSKISVAQSKTVDKLVKKRRTQEGLNLTIFQQRENENETLTRKPPLTMIHSPGNKEIESVANITIRENDDEDDEDAILSITTPASILTATTEDIKTSQNTSSGTLENITDLLAEEVTELSNNIEITGEAGIKNKEISKEELKVSEGEIFTGRPSDISTTVAVELETKTAVADDTAVVTPSAVFICENMKLFSSTVGELKHEEQTTINPKFITTETTEDENIIPLNPICNNAIMNIDNVTTETREDLKGATTEIFSFDEEATTIETDFDETRNKIVVALLELDRLRQEKQDTEKHITKMIDTIETLLETEETDTHQKNLTSSLSVTKTPRLKQNLPMTKTNTKKVKKPRKGKIFQDKSEKGNLVNTGITLFVNIQSQLAALLNKRHQLIADISTTITRELTIIREGLTFFQRLVEFKLDQGTLLLGDMNPILKILQSGSTPVFMVINNFFDAISDVLAFKGQFLRSFSADTSEGREAGLLKRIARLKIKKVLPTAVQALIRIHASSEEIGDIIKQIIHCVDGLAKAKTALIESVGHFVDRQVEFLRGVGGPSLDIRTIVEGVRNGNLHELLNYGPVSSRGVPFVSPAEVEQAVGELVGGLVSDKVLGVLAGPGRERVVREYLAREVSQAVERGRYDMRVRRGEALLQSWLPGVHLGGDCGAAVNIGKSWARVVVTRDSPFTATKGLSIHSHTTPTLDIVGQARAYVNIHIQGGLQASIGTQIMGKCFQKLIVDSPVTVSGAGVGDVFAKVTVYSVRLETRTTRTQNIPLLGRFLPNITAGIQKPHLVFKYGIKLAGTIAKFDISRLDLTGCRFKFLGIKMFYHCDLVENLVKKKIQDLSQGAFPLSDSDLVRQIEEAVRMRVGEEISIPLSLSDNNNLEPVNNVVTKAQDLVELSTKLIKRVSSFTQQMESVKTVL